jgi:catechol 2,3-dioxygenase-like lactoylglutathione lyase family enzyme
MEVPMTFPSYVLLAVADPRESIKIYNRLLGLEPVELSDTFALYVLPTGWKLGLWKKGGMEPAPLTPGGSELGFPLAGRSDVDRLHDEWRSLGLAIIQHPTDLDFGYTFVAADSDGHRLRVFALSENPG